MSYNTHSDDERASPNNAHPDLEILRARLRHIQESIENFQPITTKPSILDSSVDIRDDEEPWLQQEVVPGLKILRQAVRRDLDVLEGFLANPDSASLPALSTNAPYLIAVWREVVFAPGQLVAIFKAFASKQISSSKNAPPPSPNVQVDVVADHGRHWVRVNTVKNARMLAEFRELDSYLTSSENDSDDSNHLSPARTTFDNSVLRMGRSLIAAAKANPLPGANEIPHVTLRLTRLDPDGDETDSRIALTIRYLRDMGIDVQLGERQDPDVPAPPLPTKVDPLRLQPTPRINLDLSVLIALVSDLTHAPLPRSVEEANARFVLPQRYREWKKARLVMQGKTDLVQMEKDSADQTRALAAQVLQEMRKGMIQEVADQLSVYTRTDAGCLANHTDFNGVEFWSTEEARERCLRIVAKIGGENEKQRVHALFPPAPDPKKQINDFWKNSRYPAGFIPIIPIHIHSHHPPLSESASASESDDMPAFFQSLSKTCRHILLQEIIADPRSMADDNTQGSDEPDGSENKLVRADGEIRRAAVTKVNPRLTAHTVQSMLCGADLGWTTLTANRSSVKAILRELQVVKKQTSGVVDSNEVYEKAAIWVVDPRSLAEVMRSDVDLEAM